MSSPSTPPSADVSFGLQMQTLGLSPQGAEVLAETIGPDRDRGNPRLSGGPLVALLEVFSELARVQKQIAYQERAIQVEAMNMTANMARDHSEVILRRAESEAMEKAVASAMSVASAGFAVGLHEALRKKAGESNMNGYQMASDVQMAQANLGAIADKMVDAQMTIMKGHMDAQRELLNAYKEMVHRMAEAPAMIDQTTAMLNKISNELVQAMSLTARA